MSYLDWYTHFQKEGFILKEMGHHWLLLTGKEHDHTMSSEHFDCIAKNGLFIAQSLIAEAVLWWLYRIRDCYRKWAFYKRGRTRDKKIWKGSFCKAIWEAKHAQPLEVTWRIVHGKFHGKWLLLCGYFLRVHRKGSDDGLEVGRWTGHSPIFHFFFCP